MAYPPTRQARPSLTESLGVLGIVFLLLVGLFLSIQYADRIDGAELAPVRTLAPPAPVCDAPLAVLMGAETLVLERRGMRAALVVRYDGAVRGTLFTIDLDTRTLIAPSRPPSGWSIGGR